MTVIIRKNGRSHNKALCIDLGLLFTRRPYVLTEGSFSILRKMHLNATNECLPLLVHVHFASGKETRKKETRIYILDKKCNSFYSEGSMHVGGFPFIFSSPLTFSFVCPYQLSGMY